MPNRILRDSITESESLSRLNAEEERFFYRLLSKADDYGRFDARPPILRASCFKLMLDAVSDEQVAAWLKRLADPDIDVVHLYQVGGRPYGEFRHWHIYQRPPRAQESKYPEPPTPDSRCCQMTTSDKQCEHMLSDAPVVVVVNEVVNGIEDGDEAVVVVEAVSAQTPEDLTTTAAGSPCFLDEVKAAYEANIGTVTPVLAEVMREFDARVHPPPGYGALAVQEAVEANVRKWSYIAAILERWCAQGGKGSHSPPPKRLAKRPPRAASTGDPKRYISEYVRRRGNLPEARDSPTTAEESGET